MFRVHVINSIVVLMFCLVTAIPAMAQNGSDATHESGIHVGTFDSRAVAIACYRSNNFKAELSRKFSGLEKAKADGDEKRIKELKAEGPALQEIMHLQSFGTWPIDDVLKRIKDKLPGIAKQANVQVIVSKWDIVYQQNNIEFVDVTDQMVKTFEPDAETLKIIKDIRDKAPISNDEIKKHKH